MRMWTQNSAKFKAVGKITLCLKIVARCIGYYICLPQTGQTLPPIPVIHMVRENAYP